MSLNESDILDESRGRRRSRGLTSRGRWVLFGVAISLVLGIAVMIGVSQTQWGRAQVLAYTIQAIGGRLNGVLVVDGGLQGNLIGGARLYQVSLSDEQGEPLAVVDSVYIRYRVATFLGGDIAITRLDVYGGDVHIFRLPGDTLWNYQRILEDTTSADAPGDPRAILIERAFLHETHVRITLPVEPDSRLSPRRQEEELALILADTARYVVEAVPGGYVQHNTIDVERAEVAELYLGGRERGGTYLDIVDAVADIRLWRDPPLEVRGATASIHLDQDGILGFRASRVELPNSSGSAVGSVDLSGDRPLYDVAIETERFSLADLRWLYPWLPDDPDAGTGSVQLRVEDRQDGLLVVARNLDLVMPDTHVTGDFGIITDAVSETIRFVDVDLEADPLRVESVEALLPEDLPVEGLVIDGATIRGES